MLRIAVLVIAAAASVLPVRADPACSYIASNGDVARPSPAAITIIAKDGTRTDCTTTGTGTGVAVRTFSCSDGLEGVMFFADSAPGADDKHLLIFGNEVWYFDACHENA